MDKIDSFNVYITLQFTPTIDQRKKTNTKKT